MNVEERRLADWLHEVTPEPPHRVTVEQVAQRVAARQRAPRWLPAVAAAVVVMIVAALAFALSHTRHTAPPANPATQGSTSSAPSPSPSQRTRAPGALPVHPWHARLVGGAALQADTTAALDGRLYAVTSQAVGTSHIVRLDPRTGQELARSTRAVSSQVRPLLADGLVWTVSAGGTTVLGLDPVTLGESTRISVPVTGSADEGVALTSGRPVSAVLLGAGRTVAFVDPGHVVRRLTVDAPVSGVALSADRTRLYVATSSGAAGALETRDPRTGAPLAAPIANEPMLGLLPTAGGLWDTGAGGHAAGIEFRPRTALSAATRPRAGTSGGGLDVLPAMSAGVAWLGGSRELGCADPDSGALRADAPVGSSPNGSTPGYISGMAALNGKVYAIFSGSVHGRDETALIEMTPPHACLSR